MVFVFLPDNNEKDIYILPLESFDPFYFKNQRMPIWKFFFNPIFYLQHYFWKNFETFFDHFLILVTIFPDHFQTISKPSVDTPPNFRTITAPSPHLFRIIIAENLRRRCGNRAEMVRKTPLVSRECLFCFWFSSGSHVFSVFSISILVPFLTF